MLLCSSPRRNANTNILSKNASLKKHITYTSTNPPPHTSIILLLLVTLRLIIILILLPLLLLLPIAPQRLKNLLTILILQLVPLDIVLVRHGLDFLAQRIAVVNEHFPFSEIKVLGLVEFLLAPRDGEVHGGAVRDFAVVVQEPHVTTDKGGETDEVLGGVSVGFMGLAGEEGRTVTGSMTSQPSSVWKVR